MDWEGQSGGGPSKVTTGFLKQIHPTQLIYTEHVTYGFIKAPILGHELNKKKHNKIPATCASKQINGSLICSQVTSCLGVCSPSYAICQVLGIEWWGKHPGSLNYLCLKQNAHMTIHNGSIVQTLLRRATFPWTLLFQLTLKSFFFPTENK